MDFKKLYEEKLITAKEAAAMVKDGDWVEMGWCALTPVDFDKALAERVNELKDVKVRGGILEHQLTLQENILPIILGTHQV